LEAKRTVNKDFKNIKISFIGLGVMGFPMAGHLAQKGYCVTVYNRTALKTQEWLKKFSGSVAPRLIDCVNADYILTCVSNDQALKDIFWGSAKLINHIAPGTIVIDHSTTTVDVAKDIDAALQKRQAYFLDAPVSGGQAGAEQGILTIMAGGSQQAYNQAETIFTAYGKNSVYMGSSGSGQLTKMVNQICIAGVIQSLAEGLEFAYNAGLDQGKVIHAISHGAAASWQMHNRAETMIKGKFDFGFAVNLMKKDLMICLNEAVKNNSSLPITSLITQFYTQLQQKNGGSLDTSSLIKLLQKNRDI